MKQEEKNYDLYSNQPQSKVTLSPYKTQYLQFFNLPAIKQINNQFESQLYAHDIVFDQTKMREESIYIKEIRSSSNHEVVMLEIALGPFFVKLTILNRKECSLTHDQNYIGKGSMGTIYEYQLNRVKFAVKCINCKDYFQKKSPLLIVIQQYCFLKIASALKIGPQLINLLGFDLICYNDCIQFTMQRCLPVTVLQKSDELTLKKSLLLLHYYQIIHFDIKPSNIGFSSTFNKCIFLDFGLTKLIKQKQGTMKLLNFIGTMGYCSQQMKILYYCEAKGWVDSYYNDVIGLKCTFQYFYQSSKSASAIQNLNEYLSHQQQLNLQQQQNNDTIDIEKNINENHAHIIFYFIFVQYTVFTSYLLRPITIQQNQKAIDSCKSKIAQFLLTLHPTEFLRQFYINLFKQKAEIQYEQLHRHFIKQIQKPFAETTAKSSSYLYRLSSILNYQIDQINHKNKRQILNVKIKDKLIKGSQGFSSLQEYYQYFLAFIAFNRFNNQYTLKDKIKVTVQFLRQNKLTIITTDKYIQNIYTAVNFLLQYCLQIPFTQFKRYFFDKVIEQYFILNIGSTESVIAIINSILYHPMQIKQKLRFISFMRQKISWLEERIIFHRPCNVKLLKDKLYRSYQLILMCQNFNQPNQNNYIYYFLMVLAQTWSLNMSDFQMFRKVLWLKIHQSEFHWLVLNALSVAVRTKMTKIHSDYLKLVEMLKQFIQDKKSDYFHSYSLSLSSLYIFTNDRFNFQHLINPLKASLGQLYNYFSFSVYSFRLKKNRSQKDLIEYLQKIIEATQRSLQQKQLSHTIIIQLLQIYLQFSNHKTANKQSPIFKLLQKINVFLDSSHEYIINFILAQFDCQIRKRHTQKLMTYYFSYLIKNSKYKTVIKLLKQIPDIIDSCKTSISINKMDAILTGKYLLKNIQMTILTLQGNVEMIQILLLKQIQIIKTQIQSILLRRTEVVGITYRLMIVFMNHQIKRQHYAILFYQESNSPDYLIYYFKETSITIYVVLQALYQEKRVRELREFIVSISQFLEKHCSRQNLLNAHNCFNKFVQQQKIIQDSYFVRQSIQFYLTKIRKYPYLSLMLSIMMTTSQILHKKQILMSLCLSMNHLNGQAKDYIQQKYSIQMMTYCHQPKKYSQMNYKYNLKHNQNKIIRTIRKYHNYHKFITKYDCMLQKIKKYSCNCKI